MYSRPTFFTGISLTVESNQNAEAIPSFGIRITGHTAQPF